MVDVGEPDYASRGGHKLAGALAAFAGLEIAGRRCLDAGASTGGFTDVLLRAGARSVVAVDVGYGQLAWRLRTDERVQVLDRTNVRTLTPDAIGGPVDLTVADLSFISLGARAAGADRPAPAPTAIWSRWSSPSSRSAASGWAAAEWFATRPIGPTAVRAVVASAAELGWGLMQVAASPLPGPGRQRGILCVVASRTGAGRRRRNRRGRVGGWMRSALVVTHTARAQIAQMAVTASQQLADAGFEIRMVAADAAACNRPPGITVVDHAHAAEGAEIVLAFGGDGTFLRAAELARPFGVAMLGVNFGHVGFLAAAEPDELTSTVAAVVDNGYQVEELATIDAEVWLDGELLAQRLGAERGVARAHQPRTDPRGRGRGRLAAAAAVRLRRRAVLDADRLDGLRLLGRRPDRVAERRRDSSSCRTPRTRCSPVRSSSRRGRWSTSICSGPDIRACSAATVAARSRCRPGAG